ncbi:Outer membrane protein assembly factor BamB [Salinisphaera shabanensis E1L3A]|uniref:Outer membrane protein assembly factor BamB n=1 Tax=Salinisphaera shabanensis E1L3A TaxID=1033802 RepID=U2ESL9_9GAMM|nr:outer membrane protein assembly factor BamB [Salinisphaera shabanensis]ERJ20695.1 Outer membrane protein assembly factor BamB [Salinisphaera shabanensis E1L3A]
MNQRNKPFFRATGAAILLAASSAVLTACGGAANVAEPTPLTTLESPAYRMQTVWKTDAGEGAGEYVSGFKPIIDGERVYVGNSDGYVMALDLATGRKIWRSRTGDRLISGPALAGGLLLLGSRDGQVVALSAQTGEREWTASLSSEIIAAPAANDEIAVARTLDGRLVALDMANGQRRWTIERNVPTLTLRGTSSPVIVGDTVYAGLDNGNVLSLDLATGEERWSQTVAFPSGRSELERIVDIDADPLVVNNELYAVSAGGQLASLATTSGRVRWRHELASEKALALDDRNVYAVDRDSVAWAVNRLTGSERWQQDGLKYRKLSGPALLAGDLVVGDYDGYVHWLSADDGSVIARGRPFDEPIRSQPLIVGDRVIVVGAYGEVAALRFTPSDER